jgi:hypothetical protein
MQRGRGIKYFAYSEIILGLASLGSTFICLLKHYCIYPPASLAFLLITAFISISLGLGILKHNVHAYHLLIFFSGLIVLSKILIFGQIISLNQNIITLLPPGTKNMTSLIYHSLLIFYFTRKPVIDVFSKTGPENAAR